MFYKFDQNNSGGHFDIDDNLCPTVFIEAKTKSEAIFKAEDIGIYFYGVDDGLDCPCCGDRWSHYPREYETLREGIDLKYDFLFCNFLIVHFADGTKKKVYKNAC